MAVLMEYKITQKRLTDIVQGRDKSLPRNIAINMLPASKVRRSVGILNKLLIDEAEEVSARHLAAVNLWKSNTPTAHKYLLKAAQKITNGEILGSVVKALGRVGDKKALDTVVAIEEGSRGLLKAQASFAASLISYRRGLEGHDLPVPTTHVPIPAGNQTRLKFTTPTQAEVDVFTSSLDREPYGIAFSKDLMHQFICAGGRCMVALNQQLSNGNALSELTGKKAMVGVLAAKNSEDGRYSATHLILSSPGTPRGKVNILVYSITGTPAWAGETISVDVNQAKFELKTVETIGVVPMQMEVVLSAKGKLTVTKALSVTRVSEKKHPVPHK
jgi:hypothetical protein